MGRTASRHAVDRILDDLPDAEADQLRRTLLGPASAASIARDLVDAGHDIHQSSVKRWRALHCDNTATPKTAPRVLVYDVETRPPCSFHWQHRGDMYIGPEQMLDPGGVMAWSAQWLGDKRVMFASDHHDGHEAMVRGLHALLEEATIVVGFNHERFDNPHCTTEFDALGLPRLGPVPQIDLLKIVRSTFRLPHNTLKYVSQRFNLTRKVSNDGWPLWTACVVDANGYPYLGPIPQGGGSAKDWAKMRKYARGDTRTTTELYWYLRQGGHIKKHPHVGLFGGPNDACPACGHDGRTVVKDIHTLTSTYPGYRCDECSAIYRGTTRIGGTTGTRAA